MLNIITKIKNKIAEYEAYLDEQDHSYFRTSKNQDPHTEMYNNMGIEECLKNPECKKSRDKHG